MERWSGKLALVTGASSGIGAAVAVALANHGMKVVGCARTVQKIKDLQKKVKNPKGSIIAVQCDARKESDIMAVVDVCKKNGGIDVCINNAGLANAAPLLSAETEKWREMMDINVIALCIFTREAYKSMKERNVTDGHIIHVSSWAGHIVIDSPMGNFYTATKHMVKTLLLGLRNEVKATGTRIRVSELSPGGVETNFATNVAGQQAADVLLSTFKHLSPQDTANAILNMLGAPPHVEMYEVILLPTEQYDTALGAAVQKAMEVATKK